ncbi:hypothetical protein ACA910_020167 [Epithemia clementina (nom. ined.)]
MSVENKTNKKILVLGGTGFLGQAVCQEALKQGFQVTSLSRRGLPPPPPQNQQPSSQSTLQQLLQQVDYRQGDATQKESITNILNEKKYSGEEEEEEEEGYYVGIVHCIGLLLDGESGLGDWNRFASGSGSLVNPQSSYDAITRQTAFHAMEAALEYHHDNNNKRNMQQKNNNNNHQSPRTLSFPFCFTSAAEAGWPDLPGGSWVEANLAPDFLKRYLAAKRAVEAKLLSLSSSSSSSSSCLRPIIVRPSLIYSMDRPASYLPVGTFFALNKLGIPLVDRPVTVQALAKAILYAIQDSTVQGILRYHEIDRLAAAKSN